ncbi:MAG: DUF2066 domain-containing protein [Congregibacter sp.]
MLTAFFKREPRSACLLLFAGPLFALLVGGFVRHAQAEVLADVYAAEFYVDGRQSSVLRLAQRDGLAEVMIKASGESSAAESPQVIAALAETERFLLSYRYEESEPDQLKLRLEYDEQAVRDLLQRAGLPLWTAKRPEILVWLVSNEEGRRRFVSAAEAPAAESALRDSFRKRGVPLLMPLFDLQDARSISPGAAWRQSSASLIEASARYPGATVLAGRVARLSNGNWTGDWKLLDNGRWRSRSSSGANFGAFTDAGAALVAQTLASRYAVSTQENQDQRYQVTLRGVRSYADYSALQSVLGKLEAVQRVVPERLIGDQVTLRIDADADEQQLSRIIELDGRFVPYSDPGGEPGLHYEWIQ